MSGFERAKVAFKGLGPLIHLSYHSLRAETSREQTAPPKYDPPLKMTAERGVPDRTVSCAVEMPVETAASRRHNRVCSSI
jgi:hypothetical protein